MKQILALLTAGLFAAGAFAQTQPAPAEPEAPAATVAPAAAPAAAAPQAKAKKTAKAHKKGAKHAKRHGKKAAKTAA